MQLLQDPVDTLVPLPVSDPVAPGPLPAVCGYHDRSRPAVRGPALGEDEIALVGVADLPLAGALAVPSAAWVVLHHGAEGSAPLDGAMSIRFVPDPALVSELPALGDASVRTWHLDPLQRSAIIDLFTRIRAESAGSRPGRAHASSAWLRILLTMVARLDGSATGTAGSPEAGDPEVQRLCQAIDDRRRGLAHGPLAEAVPNYDALRHRFLRIYGESPNRMLLRTRIETAKDLLARTDRSMAEIARATGYTRQHELARAFHRVVGCTPTAWRRRARATSGRV